MPLLMDISRSHGVFGDHCLLLECIEDELAAAVGRWIVVNIDGFSLHSCRISTSTRVWPGLS